MKKFLQHLWIIIAHLWHTLSDDAKKYAPIAVQILENIKNFEDTGACDVIAALIPSGVGTVVNEKIKEWLPKVILDLQLADTVGNITDPAEQIKAILAKLKVSSDEVKNFYYHGLASLILEKISDGKFSWSDAVAVSEYYYKNIYQHPATIPAEQPAPAAADTNEQG